jgi:PAS domain S-box-containing protein
MAKLSTSVSEKSPPKSSKNGASTNNGIFQSFIENLPVMFYAVEATAPHTPIYISPTFQAFGYPLEEWLTNSEIWDQVIHPADRSAVLDGTRQAMRRGENIDFEYRVICSDGRVLWVRDRSCAIKDKDGKYISEYGSSLASQKDQFGHSQMGGLAQTLVSFVKARTGAKMRGIELSLLQRCAAHAASLTDVNEAYLAGQTAVEQAVAGVTDKMVAFERVSQNPYKCGIKLIDLSDVANYEKKVPREWINEAGNGINQAFIDYALPLVQGEPNIKRTNGLPRFPKLKKIIAK